MKENEYAPDIFESHDLPESMKSIEKMARKYRKTKGNDIQNTELYKRNPPTNEKRASAIRAKILRRTWERYHKKDNYFRCNYDIINLILEKNSLIPKK